MRTRFDPPPHVALALAGPSAGRAARHALIGLLQAASPQRWHDDAALALSELVANAIAECGRCDLSLWYAADAGVLHVEVMDTSTQMPILQPLDSSRVGGHGLRIVESLSTRWGVRAHPHGKTVWLEIDG